MAFHEGGDGGRGSLFVALNIVLRVIGPNGPMTVPDDHVVEIDLDGRVLAVLATELHGERVGASDVEIVVEDGELAALYLSLRGEATPILRTDARGRFTGAFVPTRGSRGSVAGILRESFAHSENEEEIDAFLCVVESTGQVAVIEARERTVFEIEQLTCTEGEDGVSLQWIAPQTYDVIEVFRDDEVIANLAGDATSFFDLEVGRGRHDHGLRGRVGAEASDLVTCWLFTDSVVGEVVDFVAPSDGPCTPVRFEKIARFDAEGRTVDVFPHPAPPPSFLHFNKGLTLSIERRSLLATTSSSEERYLDKIVEFALDGTLTGFEIPRWDAHSIPDANPQLVSELGFYRCGILSVGDDLILADAGLLVRIRAFARANPGEIEFDRIVEITLDGALTGHVIPIRIPKAPEADGIGRFDPHGILVLDDEVLVSRGPALLRIGAFPRIDLDEIEFLRGDSNADGGVDLSDAVHILNFLFLGSADLGCADAADADDTGLLDLTDAVYVLNFLFLGGFPPPVPLGSCGQDPTPDIHSFLRCQLEG